MLDMLWCGDHDEDRSARFINDRVRTPTFKKMAPFRWFLAFAAE